MQACVRMNGAAGRSFIHDPLDSVSAAAALRAASEAGIDLAHAGPSRLFCDYGAHLMVAECIARADNHRFLLTNESNEDRKGKDHHNRSAPPSHKADEFHPGHIGAVCAPRARSRPGRCCDRWLRDEMLRHFSCPPRRRGIATTSRRKIDECLHQGLTAGDRCLYILGHLSVREFSAPGA